MSFSQFEFSEPIDKAIVSMGFENPTEIQVNAIPKLMNAKADFVGQAQTGTGKTAAFLLPLLENLDYKAKSVQAIVIAPTRELALQVHTELEKLGRFTGVRSTTVYGGVAYFQQEKALKKDKAQVVVGTPGRVIDLIKKGILKLNECSQLILDEADEMLNMGFLEDVQHIIDSLPAERKIWMFSATMPGPISALVKREFNEPEFVKVKKKNLTNDDIDQRFCVLNKKEFDRGLRLVLAANTEAFSVVFCETRLECKKVADLLVDHGHQAAGLHGEMGQAARESTLQRFKAKKLNVLVCTDVAARGIDVTHVTHVFNLGLPRQLESYIHRIGRTARAGQKGMSLSFITPSERGQLKRLERMTGQKLENYDLPKINVIKEQKVKQKLELMNGLKEALLREGGEFKTDENFGAFEEFFGELSKEDILKLFFSHQFNRDFRMIEETLKVSRPSAERRGASRARPSNRRSPRRSERSDRGGDRRSSGVSRRDKDASQGRRRRRH